MASKLHGQQGYAMAVLLVAMSVAAVLMTAVMPAWRQLTRREKEAELIFRGEQYVRAIGLFQKRAGPGVLPPNVDVLVNQRFLRKKFKDPITNQDFDLLTPTTATGRGAPGQPAAARGQAQAQQGRGGPTAGAVIAPQAATAGRGATGIMGVASKSKDASIRVYNGRTHYNEWQFVFVAQTQAAGQTGVPGQPTGRGGTPQRGNQPPTGPGTFGPGGGRQGGPGRGTFPQAPQGRGFPGGTPAQPVSPIQPPR
jgi:type II secretory pathway pseudopilin PulG